MKGISVIICCFNSSARLPITIYHIANQRVLNSIPWEVLIVNNASTDDTVTLAQSEWLKYSCNVPFIIINQPLPGLSNARQKGLSEAKFDYIIFCDDDNWLSQDYIRIAFETMEEHPYAGIAGGQSEGHFEIEKPFWFDTFSQSYVVEKPLPNSGYLPERREYLAGAGMIVRRKLADKLNELKYELKLTDRIGEKLLSGGDYEMCLLARFLGFKIYYNEMLKLTHFMPANRLTWKYCLQMTTVGHAIPEIYFDMYRNLFFLNRNRTEISFDNLFRELLKEYTTDMFFPYKYSKKGLLKSASNIRFLLWSYPGSVRQRKVLSAKNKIIYTIKNRKKLSNQFSEMKVFADRIRNENVMNFSVISSDE